MFIKHQLCARQYSVLGRQKEQGRHGPSPRQPYDPGGKQTTKIEQEKYVIINCIKCFYKEKIMGYFERE